MKLQTSASSILNAWKSLVDMHTRGETGFAIGLQLYFDLILYKKCTITTTLHGKRDILIKICGLSEKEKCLHYQVKWASLGGLWVIYQLSWKELNPLNPEPPYTPLFMERAVSWVEIKPKENAIGKQENNSQKDLLNKMNTTSGCEKLWSKLEAQTLMNHPLHTSLLIESSMPIQEP